MAANHALALEGRDIVAAALGIEAPAPDEMLGSMAAMPLPGVEGEMAAAALGAALETEDRIQVPIGPWPIRAAQREGTDPRILIRISAQRYNEPTDYERLAGALVRRLRAN